MEKKKVMLSVLVITIIGLVGVTGYYCYMSTYYVVTDDARIDGTIVSISPQITGKLAEFYVEEGDAVLAGQNIVRQTDFSLAATANIDLAVVKAPIAGTVIKKIGNTGETGTPGYPVALLADLNKLYVTAEVEETDLQKVKVGQWVEFSVDAFPEVRFTGQVAAITRATVSSFSLLPPQNTGGNFTKVVQRIPVKIRINDYQGCQLMPGMNVTVKIHVAR